ncbi:unnamed protein product, partial [Nesidiocoris tenuis]
MRKQPGDIVGIQKCRPRTQSWETMWNACLQYGNELPRTSRTPCIRSESQSSAHP